MRDRRGILLKPLIVWAMLLLLGAISLMYALLPGMPLKPAFALGTVFVQAALVVGALMNVDRASTQVRMAAAAGIVWLSFLFLMTFADLLTR